MRKGTKYKRWTQQEIDMLREIYPVHSNEYCAEYLHRTIPSVSMAAHKHGLHKTPEFYMKQHMIGQYKKGQEPFNKGMSHVHWMSEEGRRKSAETQFKPGIVVYNSINYRPDGYEFVRTEKGRKYIWFKPEGRRMMPKHRWLWEQAHGAIPKGHIVIFKDGDTMNCVLENLILVDRAEHIRRNIAMMSKERRAEMHANQREGRIRSIKRDKLRLRWGLEPKGRLVKRI